MKGLRSIVATILASIAVFAIFALTCGSIPLPWLDEVHILEIGRNVLDGISGPAFAAQPGGHNGIPFYFLGPLIQELSYRVLSYTGPRLSSMIGLMLASLFFALWLRLRGRSIRLCGLMAICFLLNGLLTHSVRLVRVDSWAFALLYASLLLLSADNSFKCRWRLLLCGLLNGINLFVWPSSFLFLPFVLSEMIVCWHATKSTWTRAMSDCLVFGLGSGIAALTLLALAPCGIAETLVTYYSNNSNGVVSGQASLVSILVSCAVAWGKELARDPFFMLAAGFGVVLFLQRRRFVTLGLLLLTFVAMIPSGLHTYRLLYLWPFLLLLATETAEWLMYNYPRVFRVSMSMTLAYAVWTFSVSYLVIALLAPRTPHAERARVLADIVGHGATNRVYSLSFQTYYIGRDLGWQQYRYANGHQIFDPAIASNLLSHVNVVILHRERDFYSIEEDVSPFGIVRNLVINAARCDTRSGRTTALGQLGKSLAFQAEDPTRLDQLREYLSTKGFRQAEFVHDGAQTPQTALVTVSGYDDLEIWKR